MLSSETSNSMVNLCQHKITHPVLQYFVTNWKIELKQVIFVKSLQVLLLGSTCQLKSAPFTIYPLPIIPRTLSLSLLIVCIQNQGNTLAERNIDNTINCNWSFKIQTKLEILPHLSAEAEAALRCEQCGESKLKKYAEFSVASATQREFIWSFALLMILQKPTCKETYKGYR